MTLCRLRAGSAALHEVPLLAAELHRRILSVDPCDEQARRGLIDARESLAVEGQALMAWNHYRAMMSNLAS